MTYRTPLLVVVVAGLIFGNYQMRRHPKVLSYEVEISPTQTPIPSATPTPTDKPTPTPKPTVVPTPTPKPVSQYSSQQIYEFTNNFAGQYGVDANVIRYIAICESGFNPKARNGIYAGMFQFDGATWKSFRKMMNKDPDPDLRFEAKEAVETVAFMLSIHREALWPNCIPR